MAKRIWFFPFFFGLLRNISKKEVFLIIGILLVIVGSLLNAAVTRTEGHWAWTDLLGSDGASLVLSAISHNRGLGVPYKDYWEYRPPGFLLLIDLWVKIFGFKIFSFKLLELLVRFGIGLEICFLARKIFSPFQALVIIFLTSFVFFSPIFGTMMLAEPYGLFFSLLGLLFLLYTKRVVLRFFLASFFLFLSGQMKDPYFFTVLVFVPVFFYFLLLRNYRLFFKALIFTLGGFLFVFLPLYLYLTFLGSVDAYVETFLFKSSNFHARFWEDFGFFLGQLYYAFWGGIDRILHFRSLGMIILAICFLLFYLSLFPQRSLSTWIKIKKKTFILVVPSLAFSLTPEGLNKLMVLFYSLGTFIGFSLNRGFSPHYLVMIIVPIYFSFAIFASSLENSLRILFKRPIRNFVFLLAVFFLLFPQKWIIIQYRNIQTNVLQQAYRNLTLPDGDTSVEKYINSKTSINDCIISLYGWKSPEIPLYSMRRPCSRIVQANLVNDPWQIVEYRKAIFNNPPTVIVYSLAGADMDVLRFESEVINFTKIIKNCYEQDYKYTNNGRYPLELYFPISSGEDLKKCAKNNAII